MAVVATGTPENHRLLVLFFDLNMLRPQQVRQVIDSAEKYIDGVMRPSDLVSVITYSTSLTVVHDFTADRKKLSEAIENIDPQSGQGDAAANAFDAAKQLGAIQALAQNLGAIPDKKSVIYFLGGSGLTLHGIDDQSKLHETIASALRANIAVYTVEVHGLNGIGTKEQ